jgi:hypothetical protein
MPDFKLQYRVIVIKQHGTDTKNRHIEQWNRIEGLEISSHGYSHLILDKGKNTN